jgi:protein-S-isoprenylcysteine O-methyltransferase Ste14
MTARVWSLVFLAGFIVYCALRGVYARRTSRNEKILSRWDRLEKSLILVVFIGNLLLPVLYIITPLLNFANYQLPNWAPWTGLAIMLLALWLFYRSHADLGQNWSVTLELYKDHRLVRNGVYRHIRHPMYASIFLFTIAQALMLSNWLAGWAGIVTFAPLYFLRTPREEKMMIEHFGDDYRAYMSETGRMIPWRIFTQRARKQEGVLK